MAGSADDDVTLTSYEFGLECMDRLSLAIGGPVPYSLTPLLLNPLLPIPCSLPVQLPFKLVYHSIINNIVPNH